jgi:hypothetical protein
MGGEVLIAGWLYRTTNHLAARKMREEIRRQNREQKALIEMITVEANSAWQEIEPLLDQAMPNSGSKYFAHKIPAATMVLHNRPRDFCSLFQGQFHGVEGG